MARSTTGRTGAMSIDTTGFRRLATQLRNTDRKAYRDYRTAMRAVGEVTAKAARAEISQYSKTIPDTVKVRVAGAMISVQGGSQSVPIGGLFELGNRGGKSANVRLTGGTFRHPVWGNKNVWAEQSMHPYLFKAYTQTEPQVRRMLDRVLIAAFEDSGIPVD